jgi:hypothetical protein
LTFRALANYGFGVVPRAAVAALVLLATPATAWAYVDPTAGSIFLQLLLGGVAGLLVAVKLTYRRVLTWMGRRPPDLPSASDEGDPPR